MGTVIGGLYLPRFETADLGQAANRGILGGAQLIQGQTNLLQLTELERAQQAAHVARQWEMANSGLAMGQPQGPQSYLGGAGMPQAPMTQQTAMPGQPPGPAQMVPGGQDLSQFATQGTPGQPGPGQGPPPDPMRELMQTNPDAARIVQERMLKIQEGTLKRDIQKFEYVGRILQGVTDQESLQDAHKEIGRSYPDLVGKLPQTYSKEALAPLLARAFEVKERAALGLQEINARTNAGELALKQQQLAGTIPEYVKGAPELNAHIDALMKRAGLPPGSTIPSEITEQAQKNVLEGKTIVSAAQGSGQIVFGPQGAMRIGKDNQVELIKGPDGKPIYDKPTAAAEAAASYGDRASRANENAKKLEDTGLTPSFWAKTGESLPFGIGNYLIGDDRRSYRQAVTQFALAILRKESGAVISKEDYDYYDKAFFPQPGDSKKQIDEKRLEREAAVRNLQEEGKRAGRPTPQASATTGKPVSEMNAEETRAAIADLKRRSQ